MVVESSVPLGRRGRPWPQQPGRDESRVDQVENLPTLFAPLVQSCLFEHDQCLGDRLARERHLPGQPAGAGITIADEQVEHPTTRGVGDRRPQLVIGLASSMSDRRFARHVRRGGPGTRPTRPDVRRHSVAFSASDQESSSWPLSIHSKTGPLVAFGRPGDLDEHQLPATGSSSSGWFQRNEKRVGGSTVSTTIGPPWSPNSYSHVRPVRARRFYPVGKPPAYLVRLGDDASYHLRRGVDQNLLCNLIPGIYPIPS